MAVIYSPSAGPPELVAVMAHRTLRGKNVTGVKTASGGGSVFTFEWPLTIVWRRQQLHFHPSTPYVLDAALYAYLAAAAAPIRQA